MIGFRRDKVVKVQEPLPNGLIKQQQIAIAKARPFEPREGVIIDDDISGSLG